MANVLQIKRTTQSGTSVPGTDDLAFGELAWSNGTNRLFIGREGSSNIAAKEVGTRRATSTVPGIAAFSSSDFSIAASNYAADTGSVVSINSLSNSQLDNSSVSFGGVSLALGASDATPAFNLSDATAYPTSSLTGTITNTQLAGSIANSKLANSSVNFGGISVALGSSDTTPAFNLTHATSYPTSSLVGTITNAQLAGSIGSDKLAGGIGNSKLSQSAVTIGSTSVSLGGTTTAFSGLTNLDVTAADHAWAGSLGSNTLTLGHIDGTVKIAGDFEVAGENTVINSTTLETADNSFLLKKGNTTLSGTHGAGFEIDAGSNSNPYLQWSSDGVAWESSGSFSGTHGYFTGNVSGTWNGSRVARAKLATVTTGKVLGRTTASTGDMEEITYASLRGLMGVEAGATADQSGTEIKALIGTGNGKLVPSAAASTTFLNGVGVFATPPNDNDQLSTEAVQDIVGAMFSSNTETRIAATYNDTGGKINLVVDTFPTGDITGVTAGSGLSGGATSGNATLSVTSLGISTAMLANDSVTAGKIGDDQINNTHIANDAVRVDMILNDTVTYAKMQNIATNNRILGNNSGNNQGPEELTGVEVLAMLGAIDGGSAVSWA